MPAFQLRIHRCEPEARPGGALRLGAATAILGWVLLAFSALPWPASGATPEAKTGAAEVRASASRDPLASTLAGEYALQAGKLDEASRWYLDAARQSKGDAALAERAARIALLAKDEGSALEALELWRARAPTTAAMRSVEATLAMRRGDEGLAKRELTALMREPGGDKPNDEGWRYALLALDAASGNPKLAAKMLGDLVDADAIPKALSAWLAFGEFAEQLQRNDLTGKIVQRVIALFPDDPAVALLQASQLREGGKTEEARKVLNRLERSAVFLPELNIAVAREYSALGDNAAAADLLARGPQNERTYSVRASFLAQADDKTGLGKLYDELKRDSASPDPDRRLLLGQIAEFIERHGEALEWYASVPSGQQRWQAKLRTTSVLHKLDRKADAYAGLRALQTDATADDDTRRDAYLLEADLYKEDNQPAKELDVYTRALAAYADEPNLLYSRALMWERRDDIARTEADLRRVLATNPEDVNALNALGYTLADRTNRYQEALEMISRAITAQPDSAAIIDSHGWVLYRLGRKQDALVELRRAFTKQKDPEIAAHVAEVLWSLGQKDEARRYFEEARKLDPENRSLKRALEKTGVVLPPIRKDGPKKTGADNLLDAREPDLSQRAPTQP